MGPYLAGEDGFEPPLTESKSAVLPVRRFPKVLNTHVNAHIMEYNMDFLLSQILYLPFNRQMIGFLPCRGQTLDLRNHQALFSLLGNRFGGDIRNNTFQLPDLRPFDIDAPDHGIKVRREWNEHEIVPHMCVEGGIYPQFD